MDFTHFTTPHPQLTILDDASIIIGHPPCSRIAQDTDTIILGLHIVAYTLPYCTYSPYKVILYARARCRMDVFIP